jgi:histidinol-phosphate aminotransferase
MMKYQKPAELYDGLRLHQNENTGGCSPVVLEALAKLRPDQVCVYPPYEAATRACASYLGVDPDRLTLLNGLDEGLMALAVGYLRPRHGMTPEAIVPEPAFEIFAIDAEVAGGTVIRVPPLPDFQFPLERVLGAVSPNTRVVFLTNPNNPTGVRLSSDAIRTVARQVPAEAVVFVDEAYAEFSGDTFIPELLNYPNVIVGRTFSKAFGLAGLRIGAVTGAPEALEPLRLAVPVYSVNIAAVVAVQAALQDRNYLRQYLDEVEQSKVMVYAVCDRLGLTFWRSAANFVLVHAGTHLDAIVTGAAERGVYLRDRSTEPGCAGCIRIGAGILEHTRRCVAVMEEVLCAAR